MGGVIAKGGQEAQGGWVAPRTSPCPSPRSTPKKFSHAAQGSLLAHKAHKTPPRRNWSARCDGVTVVLWPVPAGGAAFELGADAKLPQARSRRSVAGTRPSGRFGAE